MANVLELVERLPPEADPQVWAETIGILTEIDALYDGLPQQDPYREWGRGQLQPLMTRVGWQAKVGEDPSLSLLRDEVIGAMSAFGDEAVIAEARARFQTLRNGAANMQGEERQNVLRVVGRPPTPTTYDQLRTLGRQAGDPQQQRQFLVAMARARDRSLAERTLRSRSAPTCRPPSDR